MSGDSFKPYKKTEKKNIGVSNRNQSLEKYSDEKNRFHLFNEIDLNYAKTHLSKDLLNTFHYNF